jgi:hypothetical protein
VLGALSLGPGLYGEGLLGRAVGEVDDGFVGEINGGERGEDAGVVEEAKEDGGGGGDGGGEGGGDNGAGESGSGGVRFQIVRGWWERRVRMQARPMLPTPRKVRGWGSSWVGDMVVDELLVGEVVALDEK